MKKSHRVIPASVIAFWFSMAATSYGQLTIHYDFTSGVVVDDNGQLSIASTLGGLSGLSSINDVNARLNLTTGTPGNPMFLGDIYSSLTFGNTGETQRTAVLLNRSGRDNTNAFGSSLSSLNVTLDDAAATNVWATSSSTGTYQADGRLSVNPSDPGVAFAAGSNGLTALNGAPLASNRVSLLVADYAGGGLATLSNWGLSATGVAAASGTFTPGANATLSDTSAGDTNTIGAILNTTGATGGSMQLNFAGTTTFSNGVTGSAGITKTGTGTVILENTSNYSGATTVSGGALVINGSTNSNTTVANSATLRGDGVIAGSVTIESGGTLAAGGSGIQSLATGELTLLAGSMFVYELNSDAAPTAAGDLLAVTGDLNLNSDTNPLTQAILDLSGNGLSGWTYGEKLTLISYTGDWDGGLFSYLSNTLNDGDTISFGGINWIFDYDDTSAGTNFTGDLTSLNRVTMLAVPETSTTLLGVLGVLALIRRRRK
jgi:autotransporter-associated beta strand protein